MESSSNGGLPIEPGHQLVRVPRHLLLFSLAVALVVPYLARLPGIVSHGSGWLLSYVPDFAAVLFLGLVNAIHAGAIYIIGRLSQQKPLVFWSAIASSAGYAMWAHGSINLSSSSTAAIGLLFIPVYVAFMAIPGAGLGWFLHMAIKPEQARRAIAWIACTGAIIFGAQVALEDQSKIAQRESRFPVVTLSEIPLEKRTVLECCELGHTEALAWGNFDSETGNEIAVLGHGVTVLLDSASYSIKSKFKVDTFQCDRCVGMYPNIAADGRNGFVIASSDGVVDKTGRPIWRLQHSSFSKIAPLLLAGELTYFSMETPSLLQRHDAKGKVLWTYKGPVLDIDIHEEADGHFAPKARVGRGNSSELWTFDLDGRPVHKLALPNWAYQTNPIAWPSRGNHLVGGGSWVGILDPQGREVLRHQILDTSFNPYHGPDGTAVRFDLAQPPYLAITSHGSSGYARSVLLVFDPKGRLVWQEELKKLRSILAVPQQSGKGEVLLVGGMDGVIEYRLKSGS